jgi:hypothetical protein
VDRTAQGVTKPQGREQPQSGESHHRQPSVVAQPSGVLVCVLAAFRDDRRDHARGVPPWVIRS